MKDSTKEARKKLRDNIKRKTKADFTGSMERLIYVLPGGE